MYIEKIEKPGRKKESRWKLCKEWAKKHIVAIVLIVSALVIASVFLIAIHSIRYEQTADTELQAPTKKTAPKKFYLPLTGVEVADENATKQAVTGVMLENSPAARPQSGLKKAGVVYEAVAEGGITRFLALYQGEKPAMIGPVRSLRLYYLSWAAGYQASVAHVGGSPNALAQVRNGSYRDIDQFFNAGSYWRSRDRYAPHNVYTSGERLDQLNNAKGYTKSEFTSFSRADGKPAESPNATSVTINLSGPLYNTSYAYDKSSNAYIRNMAGAPHVDREDGQITPKVIVALEVGVEARTQNSDGYEDVKTTGSGKAYIFQNGTMTAATWSKADLNAPLKLTDESGKDIALNRGQTWITAFTPGRGGVSWQ